MKHFPTVLVVEDNPDGACSMSMFLDLLGFRTAIARDGGEALRLAEELKPEVILLDIGLPVLDGWQVAERLRQMERSWRPLILAISGYATPADICRSRAAGIDLHFAKPIDTNQLVRVLDLVRHENLPASDG